MDELKVLRHSDKCATNNNPPTKCDCDGYHTFNELYDHRVELFIALCRVIWNSVDHPAVVWRSRRHSDGEQWDGWFIMGISTRKGKQITYHLPTTKWKDTDFAITRYKAPAFYGHSSDDVIERLKNL